VLLLLGPLVPRPAAGEEPWSVEEEHPVLPEPAAAWPAPAPPPAPGSSNPVTLVALAVVWGYQNLISPVDGATCGFYPTCGGYGRQALHKHGWLLGSLLALDRIIRNHRADDQYPLIRVHGILRLHDPVEANDFWFPSSRARIHDEGTENAGGS